MIHPVKEIVNNIKADQHAGIPSYCTANEIVLEACIKRAKEINKPVLIEATANQVNQYGGYTGMLPKDFKDLVFKLADKYNLDHKMVILGGDHLGPLTWQNLPESEAMKKAKELVYVYTLAGYTKIHLDTSMRLADDPEILDTAVIARRGVELYEECLKALKVLKKDNPDFVMPVFIIGSEVPIPGGATDVEDGLAVTSVKDFENTISAYKYAFEKKGIYDWENNVVAVVVQPGVEFGDNQVFYYDSTKAQELCDSLKHYPSIIFEGHSTDYQTGQNLYDMVNDGIGILKVGPALTYAYREALFLLSYIEKELVPSNKQANFIDVIEDVMLEKPENWQKHYHGSDSELRLARKYSYSDRIRYYLNDKKVESAISTLFDNLRDFVIPMNMLHQFMPQQYKKIINEKLKLDPKALAIDYIYQCFYDYEYACYNG